MPQFFGETPPLELLSLFGIITPEFTDEKRGASIDDKETLAWGFLQTNFAPAVDELTYGKVPNFGATAGGAPVPGPGGQPGQPGPPGQTFTEVFGLDCNTICSCLPDNICDETEHGACCISITDEDGNIIAADCVDGQSPITCVDVLGGVWLGAGTTCGDPNVNCFPDPDSSSSISISSSDTCFGPWCSTWEGSSSDTGTIHPTWPPWWGTSSSTSSTSSYVPPTYPPTMGPTDDSKKHTTSGPTHEYEECCSPSGCYIDFEAPTPEEALDGLDCGEDDFKGKCPCIDCLTCGCVSGCQVTPGDSTMSCPDCGLPEDEEPEPTQLPRWPDPESPWDPDPESPNGWRVAIPPGCCCSGESDAEGGVVNEVCVTVTWEVQCFMPNSDGECNCQYLCSGALCGKLTDTVPTKTQSKCKECCSQPFDEPDSG
jgi:hypothetical protein